MVVVFDNLDVDVYDIVSLNLPKRFAKSCRRCVSRPNMYLKDWKLTGQRKGHFLHLWQVAQVEINRSHS